MKRLNNLAVVAFARMNSFKRKLAEEKGAVDLVTIILILVVVVAAAALFGKRLTEWVSTKLDEIFK